MSLCFPAADSILSAAACSHYYPFPQCGRLCPQTMSQVFCHSNTTQERTLVPPVNQPSSEVSSHKQKLLSSAVRHWLCFRNEFQRKVPCAPSPAREASLQSLGKLELSKWGKSIPYWPGAAGLAWKSVLLPHSTVLARQGL